MKTIAIGGDHAGFDLKSKVIGWLEAQGHKIKDFGTYSSDSVDYPDFAHPVAKAVEQKEFDSGVLICGSANGVAMAANKHQSIRAAICWNEELAILAKEHNNANVLCLPSRFVDHNDAITILKAFLAHEFEGGRHQRRVNKISC